MKLTLWSLNKKIEDASEFFLLVLYIYYISFSAIYFIIPAYYDQVSRVSFLLNLTFLVVCLSLASLNILEYIIYMEILLSINIYTRIKLINNVYFALTYLALPPYCEFSFLWYQYIYNPCISYYIHELWQQNISLRLGWCRQFDTAVSAVRREGDVSQLCAFSDR